VCAFLTVKHLKHLTDSHEYSYEGYPSKYKLRHIHEFSFLHYIMATWQPGDLVRTQRYLISWYEIICGNSYWEEKLVLILYLFMYKVIFRQFKQLCLTPRLPEMTDEWLEQSEWNLGRTDRQ
jgi:hypothetical protein